VKNANLTPMQTTDHPYFELNTSTPRHAKAYLIAASHFLSGWPQEWSAERLALALVDEESPDQKKVNVWDAVTHYAASIDSDPFLQADSLACDLAENLLTFLDENAIDRARELKIEQENADWEKENAEVDYEKTLKRCAD